MMKNLYVCLIVLSLCMASAKAEGKVIASTTFENKILNLVQSSEDMELLLCACVLLENYYLKQGNIIKAQEYQAYIYECREWMELTEDKNAGAKLIISHGGIGDNGVSRK